MCAGKKKVLWSLRLCLQLVPCAYLISTVSYASSFICILKSWHDIFFLLFKTQTVQTQQRAERDAAIARLEQSRIVLALRLADHHGKNYKVIEEARAFVGDVQNHAKFVPAENIYTSAESYDMGKRSNILAKVISSFNFVKRSLKVDHLGGVLGNAALFAVSMLALLHLHQVADRERYMADLRQGNEGGDNKNVTKVYLPDGGSSNGLDVLSARG